MAEGGDPGDLSATVVAHEVKGLRAVAARRGEIQHVGNEPIDAVGSEPRRIGSDAGRVAALIWGDRAIARGAEGGNLLAPRMPRLRIPVEAQPERSVDPARALRGESSLGSLDGVEHAQSRDMTKSAKSSITRYCRLSGGERMIFGGPRWGGGRPRPPISLGGAARDTAPPRGGGVKGGAPGGGGR